MCMIGEMLKKLAVLSVGLAVAGALTGCDEPVDEGDPAPAVQAQDGRADADQGQDQDQDEVEARAGGSCEGYCGAMAPTGCWCDSGCAHYGDCCADKVQVCDGPPPDPPPDPPPSSGDVPDNATARRSRRGRRRRSRSRRRSSRWSTQRRASGATCGSTIYGPAGALTMNPALRCAGRKHDSDMITNNFFSHTGTGPTTPWDRIASAGYGAYTNAGENIAAGQTTPAAVVAGWMASTGHCQNIMNAAFEEIGVGHAAGGAYGHYWTQTFGAK
jgi:uncharacterized protein YkwD